MATTKAHCQDAFAWLKNRGWDLAPLTGQDAPCLRAISHCWQLYFQSDTDGRRAAVDAVAALLCGCQEVCWPMARELIAQAGDWSHRDEVWPAVVRAFDMRDLSFRGLERRLRLTRCHEGLSQVEYTQYFRPRLVEGETPLYDTSGGDPDDLAIAYAAAIMRAGGEPEIGFLRNAMDDVTALVVRDKRDGPNALPMRQFDCQPMKLGSVHGHDGSNSSFLQELLRLAKRVASQKAER